MNGERCTDHKAPRGVRRIEIRRLAAAVVLLSAVAACRGVHSESTPPAVPATSTRPVVPKAPVAVVEPAPVAVEPEPEEMTADQAAVVAQEYLKILVEGSAAAKAGIFEIPAGLPGIHLRKPCICGAPPDDEEREWSEYNEQVFDADGGPEISDKPYVFMDACSLHSVSGEVSAGKLTATFTAVTSYPAAAYPEKLPLTASQMATHRVLLPRASNANGWCVHGLWNSTRDVLGDYADLVQFEWDIRELAFEELSP